MATKRTPKIIYVEAHDRRRIAVQAGCDPRAVVHFLRGGAGKSVTTARIRGALQALDMIHLLRPGFQA